ncbi:MAG: exonuclease domain-containing protein [Oscillospiraceae bacterium]
MLIFILGLLPIIIIGIYATVAIMKDIESKKSKTMSSTVKELNYTPLPKSEIEIKYEPSYTPKPSVTKSLDLNTVKKGNVFASKVLFDDNSVEKLKLRYIAFDVETTGLSAYSERIIEVGAVLFENGKPVKEYGTLVNPNRSIPPSATAVNHITNDMVRKAPAESKVYAELVDFLGDALEEQTILCAHNAKFDMDFLSETLMRLGYNAKISYIDTLSASRNMVPGLENYKQPTVASHFGIINEQAHRAASDAKVCGMILSKLLGIKQEEQERTRKEKEQRELEERLKREEFLKLQKEFHEKRNNVSITPVNERVPLSELCNLNDIDKGYSVGYPFYNSGDILRKSGDIEAAIKSFDQARYNGYCHPALYHSYAMAYHQIKDYDNEIDILDEGIRRFQYDMSICEKLEIRRNKAVNAFIEQQEKIKKKEEKRLKSAERNAIPKKPQGRAVLQLSDDMTLIKKYESVSEASRVTGVNNKSIRDAATGVQKHAGGFVWKYADECNNDISSVGHRTGEK